MELDFGDFGASSWLLKFASGTIGNDPFWAKSWPGAFWSQILVIFSLANKLCSWKLGETAIWGQILARNFLEPDLRQSGTFPQKKTKQANKATNQHTNQHTKQPINKRTNEQTNKHTKQTNKQTNKQANKQTKPNKTKHNKTKQNKPKQTKPNQNKTKQNKQTKDQTKKHKGRSSTKEGETRGKEEEHL